MTPAEMADFEREFSERHVQVIAILETALTHGFTLTVKGASLRFGSPKASFDLNSNDYYGNAVKVLIRGVQWNYKKIAEGAAA